MPQDYWHSPRRWDDSTQISPATQKGQADFSSVRYNDALLPGDTHHASCQPTRLMRLPSGGMPMYGTPPVASTMSGSIVRVEHHLHPTTPYVSVPFHKASALAYGPYPSSTSESWPVENKYSPVDSVDEISNPSDHGWDSLASTSPPPRLVRSASKGRPQRKPSNRDEFDGPQVQFLARPTSDYIAMQEREMPHLPTHLLVSEQESLLVAVNDRLSQCAFDFIAKYQFPIPITQDMRPVQRPQDREWTEWVYLLKRLATKRRIPARVLYNRQIKQFTTILENSLEMRYTSKNQARPLKDDRHVLQLISAGIQVAKILKDAAAMDYLDRLYVSTEQRIQSRAAASAARFR